MDRSGVKVAPARLDAAKAWRATLLRSIDQPTSQWAQVSTSFFEKNLMEKLLRLFSRMLGERFSRETLFSPEFQLLFVFFGAAVLLSAIIILRLVFIGEF
ncbi:hypothetical protein ACWPMX_12380 [Tsuneonella sp. HG094]